MFGRAGNVLSPQEMMNFRRKAGLCTTCGITQTHTRTKRRLYVMSMRPVTDEHSYKGHCLRCGGGIARVKQSLGEQPTAEELAEATNRSRGRHRHGHHSGSRGDEGGSSGDISNTASNIVSSRSSESGRSSGPNVIWTNPNPILNESTEGNTRHSNDDQRERSATVMDPCDDDSTRPVADRGHRFHIVDTGAFHLRHSDPSVSSCGRTVESLALDSEAMSHTGSMLEDERRESHDTDHFLGRLNRTNSWDDSMAVRHDTQNGGDNSSTLVVSFDRLEKVSEDDEENVRVEDSSLGKASQGDEAKKAELQNVAENGDLIDSLAFMAAHKTNAAVVSLVCYQMRDRAPQEQMALASEIPHGGAGDALVPPTLRRGTTLAVINILPPYWAKLLLSEMEIHISNGQLLGEITQTLWIISGLHNRFKSDICDCGGIDVVSNAMRCHPDDGPLQAFGCGLFTSLLSSDMHAAYFRGSSGAVFERLLSVSAHSDSTASANALHALFTMYSSNDDTLHEKFRKASVIDSIVDSFERHASSLAVQEVVVDLLWALSNGSHCSLPTSLILSGSLIASISTAIDHKKNGTYLLSILGLLCNVTSDIQVGSTNTISLSLADICADAIICALKEYPIANSPVHRYACQIIKNVLLIAELPPCGPAENISPDRFKQLLAEKGVVEIILERTMQKPWFDNALLQDACDALTSICIGMPSIKNAVVERDGIRIAMEILHANTGLLSKVANGAKRSACLLLSSLALCTQGIAILSSPEVFNAIMQQLSVDGDGSGATSLNPLVMILLANRCDKGQQVDSFASIFSHISRIEEASKSEAEYCLSLICSLTRHMECLDILTMSQGAVAKILTWMEAFSDSIVVQKNGLKIFSALYDKRQENLGSLREISVFIAAIQNHRCRGEVQDEAMLCVYNLCSDFADKIAPDPAAISVLLGSIDGIKEAMKANDDFSAVQVGAINLLWTLTDLSITFHPKIVSGGIINDAMLLLETDLDKDVRRASLGLLAAMSSDAAAASEMASKEAIGILLGCVDTFQDERQQIQHICTLMSSISFVSHEARLRILERHDVFDAISSCMQLHNQSPLILKDSFALLVNIAIDDVIQRRLYEGGVVQIIDESLGNFSNDVGLHREACELLWCLSHVIPGQEVLECNILSAIVQSASIHKQNAGIQLSCIETLWILAAKGSSNKQEVAFMGGIDVVVTGICVHGATSAVVAEKGCVCLWCLAFDPETCVSIGRRGGIDAIQQTMIANAASAQVQCEALGAIKTLASCSENKAIFQECHAIDIIVRSMWIHCDNEKIQEAGMMAITNIAVDPKRNEVLPLEQNQLELIINAARHFPQSESVQEQACILLRNYTFNTGNIGIMRNNPLLFECLATALDRYPGKCGNRANFIIERLFG